MATVKIYEIYIYESVYIDDCGRGYTLRPFSGNTTRIKGETLGSALYDLPEGYRLGESAFGETFIYDNKDNYCELRSGKNSPVIVTRNGDFITLRKINAQDRYFLLPNTIGIRERIVKWNPITGETRYISISSVTIAETAEDCAVIFADFSRRHPGAYEGSKNIYFGDEIAAQAAEGVNFVRELPASGLKG
jgi:hypothetical protein